MRKIRLLVIFCLLFLTGCGQASRLQETHLQSGVSETEETRLQSEVSETESNAPADYIDFFAEEQVHNLYVEISEEDWQGILADPEAQEYCSVSVTIDETALRNVGFRTRGNSSLRMARRRRSERYPFRLKFDEYVEDQRFLGLDELVLTNSTDDPSYLREYLGYEAFRQLGMDVPYVTFFNLYINGELHGLYIGVEAVDNRFLKRVFDNHNGNLYKAEEDAGLMMDMDMELLEQKKGADESKTDLTALIRILDEMPLGEKGEIESILDVNSVLQYMAGNAVIHNWDDYAGQFAHNYYFYMNDGLFRMIPWDMNEGFLQTQAFYRESDGARQDIASPVTGNATLKERIASSVKQDSTSFFTYGEFEQEFDSDYHNGLAGFVKEREAYLTERLPELL